MKKRLSTQLFRLTFILSGLIAVTASSIACAAPEQKVDALQLEQIHYFFGKSVTTAAKQAIRIENLGRFKYVVVAKAPDWRVQIFRNDDKTYFIDSFAQFQDTGLVSDYLVSRRDRDFVTTNSIISPVKFLGYWAVNIKRSESSLKYLRLEKGMAKQIELMMYGTFKLPTAGGLPLELIGTSKKTDFFSGMGGLPEKREFLLTTAIKTVQVSPSIFDMPTGYTKAKSVREVVAGSDTREESKDAQELFDAGRK